MAWEATYLLPLVLLVLLASGSWEQQPQLLRKLEGEEVSIRCNYPLQSVFTTKTWCRVTPAETCTILVSHPRLLAQPGNPRYVIRDDPKSGYFTITMTALREKDSGLYRCGLYEFYGNIPLTAIRLEVAPDPASHTDPTQNLAQSSTLPPVTTKAQGRIRTSPSLVTQLLPKSTASPSSPGLGGDGLSMMPRISPISIVTIVVCGILSKSLVFTFLLIATKRSFGC